MEGITLLYYILFWCLIVEATTLCPGNTRPVQCSVEPCSIQNVCPVGQCVNDYCGGCNYHCICTTDSDCPAGEWCRHNQDLSFSCISYRTEGEWCGGYTPVWSMTRCAPGMTCTDFPPNIADAPGKCRMVCTSDSDCASETCVNGICRASNIVNKP